MASRLNAQMFTGAGIVSKEITGIDSMIASSGTVGSISPSDMATWVSFVDSTSEALSLTDMRTAKNSANLGAGGGQVSLVVTTQALHEKYNSLLTSTIQMNPTSEGKRLGDAGFTNVEFEGVPVVFDENATAGAMYFINKENLNLYMLKGADMRRMENGQPYNQHVDIQHIVTGCALVTDRRASLSKLTGKS